VENGARRSPLAHRDEIDELLLAVEQAEGGDPLGATARFDRLLAADPGNCAALLQRARAQIAVEESLGASANGAAARRAAGDLDALLALEPEERGAAQLHAKALALAGDFDAALAEIARLEKEGESAPLERLLGGVLLEPRAAGRRNPRHDAELGYGHLLRSLELDPEQETLARQVETQLVALERSPSPPAWIGAALARLRRR
jgi:hypothetical protein